MPDDGGFSKMKRKIIEALMRQNKVRQQDRQEKYRG
jgi:hypothetical protein